MPQPGEISQEIEEIPSRITRSKTSLTNLKTNLDNLENSSTPKRTRRSSFSTPVRRSRRLSIDGEDNVSQNISESLVVTKDLEDSQNGVSKDDKLEDKTNKIGTTPKKTKTIIRATTPIRRSRRLSMEGEQKVPQLNKIEEVENNESDALTSNSELSENKVPVVKLNLLTNVERTTVVITRLKSKEIDKASCNTFEESKLKNDELVPIVEIDEDDDDLEMRENDKENPVEKVNEAYSIGENNSFGETTFFEQNLSKSSVKDKSKSENNKLNNADDKLNNQEPSKLNENNLNISNQKKIDLKTLENTEKNSNVKQQTNETGFKDGNCEKENSILNDEENVKMKLKIDELINKNASPNLATFECSTPVQKSDTQMVKNIFKMKLQSLEKNESNKIESFEKDKRNSLDSFTKFGQSDFSLEKSNVRTKLSNNSDTPVGKNLSDLSSLSTLSDNVTINDDKHVDEKSNETKEINKSQSLNLFNQKLISENLNVECDKLIDSSAVNELDKVENITKTNEKNKNDLVNNENSLDIESKIENRDGNNENRSKLLSENENFTKTMNEVVDSNDCSKNYELIYESSSYDDFEIDGKLVNNLMETSSQNIQTNLDKSVGNFDSKNDEDKFRKIEKETSQEIDKEKSQEINETSQTDEVEKCQENKDKSQNDAAEECQENKSQDDENVKSKEMEKCGKDFEEVEKSQQDIEDEKTENSSFKKKDILIENTDNVTNYEINKAKNKIKEMDVVDNDDNSLNNVKEITESVCNAKISENHLNGDNDVFCCNTIVEKSKNDQVKNDLNASVSDISVKNNNSKLDVDKSSDDSILYKKCGEEENIKEKKVTDNLKVDRFDSNSLEENLESLNNEKEEKEKLGSEVGEKIENKTSKGNSDNNSDESGIENKQIDEKESEDDNNSNDDDDESVLSGYNNIFIDHEAFEKDGSETPSTDSNEIPIFGETLCPFSPKSSEDSEDNDSFVVDDDSVDELLSGSGDDLSVDGGDKPRKSRIIMFDSDSSDENEPSLENKLNKKGIDGSSVDEVKNKMVSPKIQQNEIEQIEDISKKDEESENESNLESDNSDEVDLEEENKEIMENYEQVLNKLNKKKSFVENIQPTTENYKDTNLLKFEGFPSNFLETVEETKIKTPSKDNNDKKKKRKLCDTEIKNDAFKIESKKFKIDKIDLNEDFKIISCHPNDKSSETSEEEKSDSENESSKAEKKSIKIKKKLIEKILKTEMPEQQLDNEVQLPKINFVKKAKDKLKGRKTKKLKDGKQILEKEKKEEKEKNKSKKLKARKLKPINNDKSNEFVEMTNVKKRKQDFTSEDYIPLKKTKREIDGFIVEPLDNMLKPSQRGATSGLREKFLNKKITRESSKALLSKKDKTRFLN